MIFKRLFSLFVMLFASTAAIATTDALVLRNSNYIKMSNDLTIYGELGDSGGYYTYRGVNYYNLSDIQLRYSVGTYSATFGTCYKPGQYSKTYRLWTGWSSTTWSSYTSIDGTVSSITIESQKEYSTVYGTTSTCPADKISGLTYIGKLEWYNPTTSSWYTGISSYNKSTVTYTADTTPPRVESDIYSWEMNLGDEIPDVISSVKVFDKFDSTPLITVDTTGVNRNAAGVYTITYYVADKYGNGAYIDGSITVNDNKAPVLVKSVGHIYIRVGTDEWGYSIDNMSNTSKPDWESFITCTDDDERGCALTNDIPSQVNWNSVNSGYQINYNYSDPSGNLSYEYITVHVIDDTAPTIINSDIYSWEMNIGDEIPDLLTGVTVYDKWDSTPSITVDTTGVNRNAAGVYTITYYIEDKYGNGAYIDGSITVNDVTNPILKEEVGHIYIRVDTNEWGYSLDSIINTSRPDWESFITCTDDDERGCTLINDIQSQIDWNTVNPGYQVVYTFRDNSGNIVSGYITVHVIDDTPPTIDNSDILHGWIFGIGTDLSEDILKDNIIVSDNIDDEAYINWVDFGNVNVNMAGSYSITYYVADKYGNEITYGGTVTIVDTTPPNIIKVVDRIYIRVGTGEWGYSLNDIRNSGTPEWESFIMCTDDDERGCTLINDIQSQVNWNTVNSGFQVFYVYSDASGNEISTSIVVHVIDDTPPTIDNSEINDWIFNIGDEITEDMLKENITVIDNSDLNAYIHHVDFSKINFYSAGKYTITYYVRDSYGNESTIDGTVTIIDTTPPVLDRLINRIYIRVGTGEWGYSIDNMSNTSKPDWESFITCTDDDERGCTLINDIQSQVNWNTVNSGFQVIYNYSDPSNNLMNHVITVHVVDDIAPTVSVETGITVDIDDLEGHDWNQYLTIEDNYYTNGFSIDVDLSKLIGVNANDLTIENYISYEVTDRDGNTTATGGVSVILIDSKAPIVDIIDDFIYVLKTDYNHDFSKYILSITDNSGLELEDFSVVYSTNSNGYQKYSANTIYIDILNVDFDTPNNYFVVYYVTDSSDNTFISKKITITVSNFSGDVATIDSLVNQKGSYQFEYGSSWDIYQGVTAFDRYGNSVVSDVLTELSYYDGENYTEKGEINWNKIGVYSVTYHYMDEESGIVFILGRRTIEIVDTQVPLLEGYFNISINMGDDLRREHVLNGVTAFDDYDGDLTDQIEVIGLGTLGMGNNSVALVVRDLSGNEARAEINVYVEVRGKLATYSIVGGTVGVILVGGFLLKGKFTSGL